MVITAPELERGKLTSMRSKMLVETCARLRPTTDLHDPHQALKLALRRLAKRCQYLADEIDDADTDLKTLITLAAPRLLEQIGVGPEVAGQPPGQRW
ncbi:hypothetical protein [Aeromicrobium sp. UC242_57]|uniref:hypothetical protein n=1 Tax=Aeromicrobium sp. UC242_57 TaxID=3374624 RepID=UPI0037BC4836